MKHRKIMGVVVLIAWIGLPLQSKAQGGTDTLSIWVNGLCGSCKNRIEAAALKTPGVEEASWSDETRHLLIHYTAGKFKEEKLHYRVASAGHDTRLRLAPDPVYEALPTCCKYRDFANHDDALGHENDKGHNHDHAAETSGGSHLDAISGRVFEINAEGRQTPLPGAHVFWAGHAGGTTSDSTGRFHLPAEEGLDQLVVSFMGLGSDTLNVKTGEELEIAFSTAHALEEVRISHQVKATSISFTSAYNIRNISEKELCKAACCNLSESFETNPSVDASSTDAVSGTRKIEMLGLAGPYVQITRENMPGIRGLLALHGLGYIPGAWIEGMQLNTGTGTVVNGFESITGQINVELFKPATDAPLFLNAYGNSDGAMEGNLRTSYHLGGRAEEHPEDHRGGHAGGSLLLHGNYRPFALDHNGDNFMDHPMGESFYALKRFHYSNHKGFSTQAGIRTIYSNRRGGQLDYKHELDAGSQTNWGMEMRSRGLEGWAKAGKVFDKPYTSLGFQLSGLIHRQEAYYGRTVYNSEQQTYYGNLIFQSTLGSLDHQYRAGLSFQADLIDEEVNLRPYDRQELVPGAFLEYTYNHLDRFTAVAGVRADYHSIFGAFFTPRLHLRYAPAEKTVFRASAGRGQRTASVFAENVGLFASSRQWILEGERVGAPYGLGPEVAWTSGVSAAQGFLLLQREAVFSVEYHYTYFSEQAVIDLDQSPQEVHVYMLDGTSRAHSFQVQLDLEPVERFEVRAAHRINDVYSHYHGTWLMRPLTSRQRSFVNLAYATASEWAFDFTWNLLGRKRIPTTASNPELHQLEEWSPAYSLVNLQISKSFVFGLDVYAGIENVLDYRQENPILGAEDPMGPYFDASLIWGPVFGRKFFLGLRYRLE